MPKNQEMNQVKQIHPTHTPKLKIFRDWITKFTKNKEGCSVSETEKRKTIIPFFFFFFF